jgi:hypothetical protein
VLRPTLDVRLQYGDTGDWTLRALVDTGAPISFFDRGAGDAVGVRFGQAGAEHGTIRIFGGSWHVQFEHVQLTFPAEPGITWEAHVAFVKDPELQMPFQGVLGTEGFLDKFAVTFNFYYDYFIVERPDDFHDRIGRHLTTDPTRTTEHSWRRGRAVSGALERPFDTLERVHTSSAALLSLRNTANRGGSPVWAGSLLDRAMGGMRKVHDPVKWQPGR